MNNDYERDLPLEDLQLEFKPTAFGKPRCSACGAGGDVAVTRLAGGDVAVMDACPLHWPPGAITPEQWVAEEHARIQARFTRFEMLFWLGGGRSSETLQ